MKKLEDPGLSVPGITRVIRVKNRAENRMVDRAY